MMDIKYSVGMHGVNNFDDVKVVQELLIKKGYKLRIDGICGYNTIKAIRLFQRHFLSSPDAKVDTNGKTIKYLQQGNFSKGNSATTPPPLSSVNNVGDIGGLKYNPSVMSFSRQGILLLKQYEELRLKPYDDQTGKTITNYVAGATIGYGYLISSHSEFDKFKDGITETQAETLFITTLVKFEDAVKKYVKVNLTQNEFDALVIFSYNVGVDSPKSGFPGSTMLKVINGLSNEDLDTAWKMWIKSQGKVMQGLLNRRMSELNVFHKGVYVKL
ncbi:lysozyme [Brenneria corticis]|uniref:Lysozyme n=1 Tax=Brenneria corticis TaxID=2173106 RepID=A0A2U1TL36_9GAMM|nr:lysozyme [Brenneria sp. CFCC 11842]